FGSRTQGKNKTKVSYSPPRLAYPERFAVIRCADRDAYQNIDRRIDSLGIKQRQVIRLSEDKNLTDDGDASSQNLETSAQNLSVPYDDIRRLLTKVTKNSGEKNFRESSEEKIREMLNYLQTYPIDIWKDCLDRQTLNLSQSQAKPAPSSVNYRALAAMLVPSQVPEWLHWLKNLPNQKIAKDSLAFQEQFLEASRSSGRGYKKLKSLVQAGISELLCELIDNISQQNYQDIEWLLVIQENHNIWHSRFNSYADKLLDKLAILMSPEKTSEEDEFYRKLSVTFKEMEATQWRFKKGNYDKIAELVQKYEKYELSAIFFQISRGYVPRKVYDRFQRGGIGDIPFVPERSLWVWDKIQQRVLPKLLIIFGMFGTIAIGAISVYLIYEYEEKIPEFESLSLLGKAKITLSDDLKRYENASEEERSQIKEEIMKYLKVADRRNEIYIQIKDSLMPDTLPYAELLDIKSNKKKVEVVILQQILTRAGVYNGPITGYFGDRTKEAIQEYQRSEGIIADGEVTYETWFSMSRILRDAQVELVYNFLVKSFEKDQGEEARESLARCKNNGEKALYFGNCVQKLIDEL
ncbi:MAG: peptidoglycan-binding protein, partial [Hormoscilla sp.]